MGLVITKIKEHSLIKNKILEDIKNTPQNKLDYITSTDWKTPRQVHRKYFVDHMFSIINNYYESIAKKLNLKNFDIKKLVIHNYWFQIYNKDSYHDWHTHSAVHFTNVYFLELPDKNCATEIKGHPKLNVQEGDLITFPGYWLHRSPPNNSDKRKAIVSFNTSFDFTK